VFLDPGQPLRGFRDDDRRPACESAAVRHLRAMQWSDEAVVLGARRHGEGSVIVELMTRGRGRHMGLLRGGAGPRLRPVVQPGNGVQATWRGRLDEHLGNFTLELVAARAARLLASGPALNALGLAAAHCRLLPERDPHPALYDALIVLLDHLDAPELAPALLVRFELALLDELGFGLGLSECAATGARENLTHVSPKSGRAVSAPAAAPYLDRLLALPGFLRGEGASPGSHEVLQAFRLTGYFLERDVWGPRGLAEPDARGAVIAAVGRAA
jgi:DNA repair protein RecO (recombination protein O)